MATEAQGGVSFNPDDASGLLDNIRGKVTKIVVDFFTATKGKNAGNKYVQAAMTVEGNGTKHTENYLLGGADQWAPNASKTGAIALKEGGRIWNKSDVFALVKSFCDAEPKFKALVSNDLSVFVGADIDLTRVTTGEYVDETGTKKTQTRLLVTKVHAMPGAKATGKATTTTAKATAAKPAAATNADPAANDDVLSTMLIEIVEEAGGSIAKSALLQPIFMKATKAKLSSVRAALQARAQDDEFLVGLAGSGLAFDGETLSIAA